MYKFVHDSDFTMSFDQIRARAEAIRLSNRALAEKTGLAEHTIGRALKRDSGGRHDTYDVIDRAVFDEEIRTRDHLNRLYPPTEDNVRTRQARA